MQITKRTCALLCLFIICCCSFAVESSIARKFDKAIVNDYIVWLSPAASENDDEASNRKSEIRGSFDSALRAIAQDDGGWGALMRHA